MIVCVHMCAHVHLGVNDCYLVVLLRVGWGLTRRIPQACPRQVFSLVPSSEGSGEEGPGGLRGSQWITTKATLLPGVRGKVGWGVRWPQGPGTWLWFSVFFPQDAPEAWDLRLA